MQGLPSKISLFLATAAMFASGCAERTVTSYYRERAILNSQTDVPTYTLEKRELGARPIAKSNRRVSGWDDANKSHSISTGTDSIAELIEGNHRFVEGGAQWPRQSPARRAELTASQHPHAGILSCSDSRVPPEIVFDQGLGDVFSVRSAGEVPDPAGIASLEYAVEHLHIKSILVMGHASCGAVKAALSTPVGKSAGSADLNHLVGKIRPNIKGYTMASAGPNLEGAVRAQVEGVAKSLLSKSKILREAVEHHGVTVAKGLYHLDSGKVDIWY